MTAIRGQRARAERPASRRPRRTRPVVVADLSGAACATHPQQLWDPAPGETRTQRADRTAAAARVCAGCPENTRCPLVVRDPAQHRDRRCDRCRGLFRARFSHHRYCSTICRDIVHNQRQCETRQEQRRAAGAASPPEVCRMCPARLTREQRTNHAAYCSVDCRKKYDRIRAAARRAKKTAAAA